MQSQSSRLGSSPHSVLASINALVSTPNANLLARNL
jgi:hypothetical protein